LKWLAGYGKEIRELACLPVCRHYPQFELQPDLDCVRRCFNARKHPQTIAEVHVPNGVRYGDTLLTRMDDGVAVHIAERVQRRRNEAVTAALGAYVIAVRTYNVV
jgi:hypothetical protein